MSQDEEEDKVYGALRYHDNRTQTMMLSDENMYIQREWDLIRKWIGYSTSPLRSFSHITSQWDHVELLVDSVRL